MKSFALLHLVLLLLTSCTSVFFQPSKNIFPTSFEKNITPRPFRIESADKTLLSAWYFSAPTQPAKGLIVQFHGNAENMTTHFHSLHWLTSEGYDLVTFDYRGYGSTPGEASMTEVYNDVVATLNFTNGLAKEKKIPLITFGQSLGGSLLLKALQEIHPSELRMIVIDSSFYSYRQIAKEKLDINWFTKPIKVLVPLLVSEIYSPARSLKSLPDVPKYVFHSEQDPVIPVHHGVQIYNDMSEPKFLWTHKEPGHINSFFVPSGKPRSDFVRALNETLTRKIM